MVRIHWLASALVVGIALGLLIGRLRDEEPAAPAAAAAARSAPDPDSPAGRQDPDAIATFAPRNAPAEAPPPATPAGHSPADVPVDTVQFGARFHRAEPGAPPPDRVEFADPMHEEFLREQRDDSWAYLREAELENSMVMETSAGNFRKDRIECRASICEVELSATGQQVESLRRWFDEKNTQRSFSLDQPLMLRGASFSGNGSEAEARLTYVKPQRVMPPPRI